VSLAVGDGVQCVQYNTDDLSDSTASATPVTDAMFPVGSGDALTSVVADISGWSDVKEAVAAENSESIDGSQLGLQFSV